MSRLNSARVVLLAAIALTSAVASAQSPQDRPQKPVTTASASSPSDHLPRQELSESMLYEFLLGEIAGQRGDGELAARTFLDLAQRTRDPRVARRAMELAGRARLPELALEAARLWHETDPLSSRALQTVTALLVNSRRVEEAEPYLAKLMTLRGTSIPAVFMQLGRLLGRSPDREATLRVVTRLAGAYPNLPEGHFAVAQAAFAAQKQDAALESIRRAGALRPEWEAAALFEAQILQRDSARAAAGRLAAYLEQHPSNREVRLTYARLLVQDKRYEDARAQFEKLLEVFPDNPDVVYAVGLLAFQLKNYDIAESNLKRLLTLKFRDPEGVRYTLGQIAEERKDLAGAVAWYEQIPEGEHYVPARMRVAQALSRQGKLDEARKYLRGISVSGKAQQVQLIVAEAQLLREAKRDGEAFDVLGQALKDDPEQPELLYDLALTAERLQRYDVLEDKLRSLIKVRPQHAHAYNALGYSFAERNLRLEEARKLIEKALELSPEDAFIIDSMGWVLFRQGDAAGALTQLRRAYASRQDAEIGAHLGEVLWVSGAHEEARRIFEEALKNHPDNETLRKTVERLKP